MDPLIETSPTPAPPPTPVPAPASVPPPPFETKCPFCGAPVRIGAAFCSTCGKALQNPELSTTVFTQTWIYLMSVFLPPLGFWPGIKYFRNDDEKAKRIGMIAIILSVIATVATIWLTFVFLNIYLSTLNNALTGSGLIPY